MENFMHRFIGVILAIFHLALLNPCMKFEIFLTKSIIFKSYENMFQGPLNTGFIKKKV